jgi:AcrR family transcriptional regulator
MKMPDNSISKKAIKGRALKKELTRMAILDVGLQMMANQGFEKTNVSDIAKVVGVANGTFYYHFPDKKRLLLTLIEGFFSQIKPLVDNWSRTMDTSEQVANRFIRSVAGILNENKELAKIVRNESHNPDPDIRGLIQNTFNYLIDRVAIAFEVGIQLGSVRPLDSRIVAIAQVGMLKEVVMSLLDEGDEIDLDHVIEEIVLLQDFGIRPRSSPVEKPGR